MTWVELNNVRKTMARITIQRNPKSEYHRYLQHSLQKRRKQLTSMDL